MGMAPITHVLLSKIPLSILLPPTPHRSTTLSPVDNYASDERLLTKHNKQQVDSSIAILKILNGLTEIDSFLVMDTLALYNTPSCIY